ncbi:MAG: sigma 54-interacting transcriptional regulator [Clostridium sp.]|jgi:PAS domain S-box-containing protein|uniref:sigma 54-interacting transcriptional regulator n=1 Tax=Clostridium sp. TaxID=1506 RepID=UPI0025C3E529|nr:sigma 54-interacting transcriptional regulator [Clostridium sp.]MCH3965714.1 sigma 54-interacting transcriptional regulator [Clostridium sp.]MCI1717090.1 sigma 54-interacting transcriptional regulator [Clostridium sp.]MCI1801373.1 sigma 54-interacting transcriptional regulator [Clostridium sp.]MCI1815219.1 sigma 54-interacting transcriptional regulator [Clostridium sp.]MCI1872122.1 sigma 54-interacting transcriptional regulator [Clostridium sp.]
MYKNIITVPIPNGIHIRIAALIVHMAVQIKNKYGINLYIKNLAAKEPLAVSMLALVSLKIKQNEKIEVSCLEDTETGKKAVHKLCNFIINDLSKDNPTASKIDDIMEENTIAYEQIVKNIPVGIVVIDENACITTMNDYALKIVNKTLQEVTGRFVKDIIPTSDLPNLLKIKRKKVGETQYINKNLVITNRSPIFLNDKVIGAMGIFQDISDLVGIKELNERFKKILEASHELICFIDDRRIVSYVNPAYENHYNIKSPDIVGKDLINISPHGLRIKVFNSKISIKNKVYHKDNKTIISTVTPIYADKKFKGVMSISRTADELKDLLKKLENSEEKLNYYKEELNRQNRLAGSFNSIIGNSGSLKECLVIAEKASKSTSTVVIRGESGTGKELIAKAIHNNSNRRNEPLIRINCAAIPENLFESELFGYEKGAFTGAVKSKPGKFDLADRGTIFLDEIGDMPVSMQVKLLRVLQEKEFESVGGLTTHKVDVRIIAATNKNLEAMLKSNKFREDLYYRLNVISIILPPLRDRKEDINLLVEHFIKKINKKLNKSVSRIDKKSLNYLREYHWPGNIRELENIIERAINMCDGHAIRSDDLPFYIKNDSQDAESLINLKDGELATIEEYEREIISKAMKKYGSYNKVGKILGLTHRTISLKCKKYGIDKNFI